MTNLEGRVLRRRAALRAPEGARSELWIMAELARRLESPGTFSADAREVFEELRLASAGGLADYSGVDWDDLDAGAAVYWPCSAEHAASRVPGQRSGTPRLFLDGFAHPDARARLVAVFPGASGEELHAAGKLALVTGRLLEHYQSGTQTRRVAELAGAAPEARLEIHPATARAHGIAEGQRVAVRNERGEVVARARLTTAVRLDTVFLPFHFAGKQNANLLTDAAVDPISAMPGFKNAPVSLHALGDES